MTSSETRAITGRNVLYPGGDAPRAVAGAVAALGHEGADVDGALGAMGAEHGQAPELVGTPF